SAFIKDLAGRLGDGRNAVPLADRTTDKNVCPTTDRNVCPTTGRNVCPTTGRNACATGETGRNSCPTEGWECRQCFHSQRRLLDRRRRPRPPAPAAVGVLGGEEPPDRAARVARSSAFERRVTRAEDSARAVGRAVFLLAVLVAEPERAPVAVRPLD